jgi:hypothetical protein
MAAAALPIPDLLTVWVPSTMTEVKIQALVARRLLRPKAEVEWKAAAGEEFPTEDVKEHVVFASFFERGFNIPTEGFLPRFALLLQVGAGTPHPQFYHCSINLYTFL